jgi:hypothetical protein
MVVELYYELFGRRYREDGPAIEYVNGGKEWWFNDKLHRKDGPAVSWADGHKEWWFDGRLHREDGPAIERNNGDIEWWLNGERHREDGPAIERIDGGKLWYLNGKLHREDGPAVIYRDGVGYWICGHEISEKTFKHNRYIYIVNKIIAYYDCYLNNMCMEIIETIVDKLEEEFLFLSVRCIMVVELYCELFIY